MRETPAPVRARNGYDVADAVEAERPPVVAVDVVADEIPGSAAKHVSVRVNEPPRRVTVLIEVGETDPAVSSRRLRDRAHGLRDAPGTPSSSTSVTIAASCTRSVA